MVFYVVRHRKMMSIKSRSFAVLIATTVIFYIICRIWLQSLQKPLSADTALHDFIEPEGYNIHNCITEDVVGNRPHVHLVPLSEIEYRENPEDKEHRKSSFKYIFDNRIWGGNRGTPWRAVELIASGNISHRYSSQLLVKNLTVKMSPNFKYNMGGRR